MAPSWSLWAWICSFIWVEILIVSGQDEIEGLSTLVLEHSFDSGPNPLFTRRGTITLRSLKSGEAVFSSDVPFSSEDRDNFKKLVETDGIYRLRIPFKSQSAGMANSGYVSTFIKACVLYESELTDSITINVDQVGNLLGLSVRGHQTYCTGREVPEASLVAFKTKVDAVQTVDGPHPETQTYIQKMDQEKAEKAKGQQADNRSFFGKYWMYLVPLFIILMFASADPNAGSGGGGRS